MITETLDPIGLCLLQELVEAVDHMRTIQDGTPGMIFLSINHPVVRDARERESRFEKLAIKFANFLMLIPCDDIDITDLVYTWQLRRSLPVRQRMNIFLWLEVEKIANAATAMYRAETGL